MMSPRLYTLTVLAGALSWAMFGMSLNTALQLVDAGASPNHLQMLLPAIWLLTGIGDVWWLLRFGGARPTSGAEGDATST